MVDGKYNLKDLARKTLITALVLAITAILTPGFKIDNIVTLSIAAIFISVVDFLLQHFANINISKTKRGIVGFFVTIIILLFINNLIAGFNISKMGAVIASVIIGIVDILIPVGAV